MAPQVKVILLARKPWFLMGVYLLAGLVTGIILFTGLFPNVASACLPAYDPAGLSGPTPCSSNSSGCMLLSTSRSTSSPLLALVHPLLADSWRLWLLNRTRMIQLAAVCLVVSIFLLTRGRWR